MTMDTDDRVTEPCISKS